MLAAWPPPNSTVGTFCPLCEADVFFFLSPPDCSGVGGLQEALLLNDNWLGRNRQVITLLAVPSVCFGSL